MKTALPLLAAFALAACQPAAGTDNAAPDTEPGTSGTPAASSAGPATTILALIPVAIGAGEGGETQAPLARVVLGGMIVSGGISLVVIPVIYNLIEGRKERREAAQG